MVFTLGDRVGAAVFGTIAVAAGILLVYAGRTRRPRRWRDTLGKTWQQPAGTIKSARGAILGGVFLFVVGLIFVVRALV